MIKETPSSETQRWNVSKWCRFSIRWYVEKQRPQLSKKAWYFTGDIRIWLNKILHLLFRRRGFRPWILSESICLTFKINLYNIFWKQQNESIFPLPFLLKKQTKENKKSWRLYIVWNKAILHGLWNDRWALSSFIA